MSIGSTSPGVLIEDETGKTLGVDGAPLVVTIEDLYLQNAQQIKLLNAILLAICIGMKVDIDQVREGIGLD